MKIEFNHKTIRTVTDKRLVSLEEFIEILLRHKPSEIWCEKWSAKKPFLVITEYVGKNSVKSFCNADSDTTPRISTMTQLYNEHRYGGLSDSYFVVSNDDFDGDNKGCRDCADYDGICPETNQPC